LLVLNSKDLNLHLDQLNVARGFSSVLVAADGAGGGAAVVTGGGLG
jgi:hypothetical protein